MQFVIHNWYLFAALAGILFLIATGPISLRLHGVKNANAAQTVQLLNREDGVVVDVREPNEFKGGHIPSAINLPYLATNLLVLLPAYTCGEIMVVLCGPVLHCRWALPMKQL